MKCMVRKCVSKHKYGGGGDGGGGKVLFGGKYRNDFFYLTSIYHVFVGYAIYFICIYGIRICELRMSNGLWRKRVTYKRIYACKELRAIY